MGAVDLTTAGRGQSLPTDEVSIEIPIEPKPKLRPRFHIQRGRISTSTPLETKAYESFIADYYGYNCGTKFEKGEPLEVNLFFGMPIPASFSKKKHKLCVNGQQPHIVKPDVDNLTKAILDALNQVAWNDDAQITKMNISKGYAEEPHINIRIRKDINSLGE